MEKEDTLSVVFALTGEHGILNDRYRFINFITYIIFISNMTLHTPE